jgi:hypothetical protein
MECFSLSILEACLVVPDYNKCWGNEEVIINGKMDLYFKQRILIHKDLKNCILEI